MQFNERRRASWPFTAFEHLHIHCFSGQVLANAWIFTYFHMITFVWPCSLGFLWNERVSFAFVEDWALLAHPVHMDGLQSQSGEDERRPLGTVQDLRARWARWLSLDVFWHQSEGQSGHGADAQAARVDREVPLQPLHRRWPMKLSRRLSVMPQRSPQVAAF